MFLRSILAGCLPTLVLAVTAAAAAPPPFDAANPIPSPGAFYVHGSNGYTVSVYAAARRQGRSWVIVSAANRKGRVTVEAPADLGEARPSRNLGAATSRSTFRVARTSPLRDAAGPRRWCTVSAKATRPGSSRVSV